MSGDFSKTKDKIEIYANSTQTTIDGENKK
jgi:hypothetical protein